MSFLKPKSGFFTKLKEMFVSKPITDDIYEQLEELLIMSDIGVQTSINIIQRLEKTARNEKIKDTDSLYLKLEEILIEKLESLKDTEIKLDPLKKTVILIVGVNGVGKTTSIAKLAYRFKNQGKSIVIAAADTFRAAAIEQIELWADKIGVRVIKHQKGTDPSAVIFDALSYANKENVDVTIIDTAGRLHNKKDLMQELQKIRKIIDSKAENCNLETLLVVDATTGQNGLMQAKIFNEVTSLTGVILTKYDGTAKGGIIFPIIDEIQKPIKFIGLGEKMEDLKPFSSEEFVKEIFNK